MFSDKDSTFLNIHKSSLINNMYCIYDLLYGLDRRGLFIIKNTGLKQATLLGCSILKLSQATVGIIFV
jgi:hypothetical protein